MRGNKALTPATAAQIKAALWVGETQASIAARFGVAQGTVSSISVGRSYEYVPWPDGSFERPSRRDTKARALGIDPAARRVITPAQEPILPTEEQAIDSLAKRMTAAEDGVATAQRAKGEILDLVDIVKEQTDREAEEEIKRIVSSVQILNSGEEAGAVQPALASFPPLPPEADQMPWEDIQTIASGRNPYVARAKDDKPFRHALCIVFRNTAPNDWAAPHIYPLIIGTMQMLGYSIEEEMKT